VGDLPPGGCKASYTTAIRAIDRQNIVYWWEPQQFSGGQKIPTFLEPMAGERRLRLSWRNLPPPSARCR